MGANKQQIKILLVDDDEGVCHSFSRLLEKRGYSVETLQSAIDAIKSLKKSEYDILLTDLKMPEMDGIELLKEARKIDADLGVIIMTGYGEIASYLKAMDLGAVEYLNKPIKINDLEIIIRKLASEIKENGKLADQSA